MDISVIQIIQKSYNVLKLLCLFSEENKDTITARSKEIPAIGTLLCSLRTKAMKKILVENKEAIYFATPKVCK